MTFLGVTQGTVQIVVLVRDGDPVRVTCFGAQLAIGMVGAQDALDRIHRLEVPLQLPVRVIVPVDRKPTLVIVTPVLEGTVGILVLHPSDAWVT